MEIAESARKHGVSDDAMRHAARNPIHTKTLDDRWLAIGADETGQLLEVVVLDDDEDDEPVIIHAMPLRPEFRNRF